MFLVRFLVELLENLLSCTIKLVRFIIRNWLLIAVLSAIYITARSTGFLESINARLGIEAKPDLYVFTAAKLIGLTWLILFIKELVSDGALVFYLLVAIIVLASIGGTSGLFILAGPLAVLKVFIPNDLFAPVLFAILALYRLGDYFAPVEED